MQWVYHYLWQLELFQRQSWGHFWEMGWSTYGLFRAHKYHLELNWSEVIYKSTFLLLLQIRAPQWAAILDCSLPMTSRKSLVGDLLHTSAAHPDLTHTVGPQNGCIHGHVFTTFSGLITHFCRTPRPDTYCWAPKWLHSWPRLHDFQCLTNRTRNPEKNCCLKKKMF